MSNWVKYYEEKLYPLQNGILSCVKNSETRFFLTGGTALSRGYFNHRYSDDLDLFLINDPSFRDQVNRIIDNIASGGYSIIADDSVFSENFISFYAGYKATSDIALKIDLVNDSAPRFGTLIDTPVFYKTDDWRNILSNKLCALLRLEIKDFSDIWIISRNKTFNWGSILEEARIKEMGLDPVVLAGVMKTIPEEYFPSIRWTSQPSWEKFRSDFDIIALDMVRGEDNSLGALR